MAAILLTVFSNIFFLNEKICIWIKISLKFGPSGSINNKPALVQIIAWRRTGDKPLSEKMMASISYTGDGGCRCDGCVVSFGIMGCHCDNPWCHR